jgi:hypothetical protein
MDRTLNQSFKQLFPVLIGLTIIGIMSHMIPHSAGFSTVGAIGMLAAAMLPRYLVPIPVLLTIITFDLIHGTYQIAAMAFVYVGHIAAAGSLTPIFSPANKHLGLVNVGSAAVLSALVFYLISNITPMVLGFYPNTLEGWLNCYVAALPFLMKSILANIVFGGFGFFTIWLSRRIKSGSFAAPGRSQ